jgi:hypothetical protein
MALFCVGKPPTSQPGLPALGCNLEGATTLPDRLQLATNFLSQANLINCWIQQKQKKKKNI